MATPVTCKGLGVVAAGGVEHGVDELELRVAVLMRKASLILQDLPSRPAPLQENEVNVSSGGGGLVVSVLGRGRGVHVGFEEVERRTAVGFDTGLKQRNVSEGSK